MKNPHDTLKNTELRMLFKGMINCQVAGKAIHVILSIGSADECFPANDVLWRHKPFNKGIKREEAEIFTETFSPIPEYY